MPEFETIKSERLPITKNRIIQDLSLLGVKPGMAIIVHSSLKSIGWVCGKEVSIIDGLLESLTEIEPVFADKAYFLSDDFSLLDCALAPLLWRLPSLGVHIPAEAVSLHAYMERLFKRSSFVKCLFTKTATSFPPWPSKTAKTAPESSGFW